MDNDRSPRLIRTEPTQGEELLRLQRQTEDLKAQQNAAIIAAFADWAHEVAAQLAATKRLLNELGITGQRWQQAVDEARRSLPQGPQSSVLALAELLRRLAE
jgi:hypothetical protein